MLQHCVRQVSQQQPVAPMCVLCWSVHIPSLHGSHLHQYVTVQFIAENINVNDDF